MENRQIKINGDTFDYELTRRKAKNIILKVKQSGNICVTAPKRTPLYEIEGFLSSKYSWLKATIEKINAENDKTDKKFTILGREVELNIVRGDCRRIEFINDRITIYAYKNDEISNIQPIFDKWYNNLACEYLQKKFAEVYEEFFSDKTEKAELKLRFMKSRWGSCYYNKNMIVLNKHLIQLDIWLIEQVIIHEYSHFFYHNHSPEFKDFLRKLSPNSDKYERILKYSSQQNTSVGNMM